jgi:hypothetical protein
MECACGCKQQLTGKAKKWFNDAHKNEFNTRARRLAAEKISGLLSAAVSTDATPVPIISNAKRPGSHAGNIYSSERLQKTLERLRQGPATTKQLSEYTGSEAVHSDIHELRQNGINIAPAKYLGKSESGKKIYQYEFVNEQSMA